MTNPPPPPPQTPSPMSGWAMPKAQPLSEENQDALREIAQPPPGEVDVVNWRLADPAEISAQFEPLREFVDWLLEVFEVKGSVVPSCWWRHPPLVQELYGLYCFHAAAYPATDQGSGPLGFLERFNLAKARMREYATESRCSYDNHHAPPERKASTTVNRDWYALANGDTGWLDPKLRKETS